MRSKQGKVEECEMTIGCRAVRVDVMNVPQRGLSARIARRHKRIFEIHFELLNP